MPGGGQSRQADRGAGFGIQGAIRFLSIEIPSARFDFYRGEGIDLSTTEHPWFALPPPDNTIRRATVIGAGLAGTAMVQALTARGWQVTLIERHQQPAQEASGNPTGILMPVVESGTSPGRRWFDAAFHRALAHSARLDACRSSCGVLLGAWNSRTLARHNRLKKQLCSLPWPIDPVTGDQASRLCGLPVSWPGLYLPSAGWIDPPSLCRAQLAAAGPSPVIHYGREVQTLKYREDQWQGIDPQGNPLFCSPIVVIAGGIDAIRFSQTRFLPIQPVRGQISELPATAMSRRLQTVVCGPGYATPVRLNSHCIGATYDPNDGNPLPTGMDHRRNWEMLKKLLPALAASLDLSRAKGRVAFRAVTPDRLPVVGPVPDETAFRAVYSDLRHGRPPWKYPPAPCHPGLYISSGYGSRGLLSTPLAAELLAAMIDGTSLPVATDIRYALHPARFLVRWLKRGR